MNPFVVKDMYRRLAAGLTLSAHERALCGILAGDLDAVLAVPGPPPSPPRGKRLGVLSHDGGGGGGGEGGIGEGGATDWWFSRAASALADQTGVFEARFWKAVFESSNDVKNSNLIIPPARMNQCIGKEPGSARGTGLFPC